jgi:hypothetical protein
MGARSFPEERTALFLSRYLLERETMVMSDELKGKMELTILQGPRYM